MSSHKSLKARDVMHAPVLTLRPEQSLQEAAQALAAGQISGAPVVSQGGELIGVLSQTDVLRQAKHTEFDELMEHGFYFGMPSMGHRLPSGANHLRDIRVDQAMSPYVVTVSPDDKVSTLASVMRERKYHRLVVTDERKVVGIVTSLDLLKLLE